jgi:VanZ family protein
MAIRFNRMSLLRFGSWLSVAAWGLTIFVLSSMSGSRINHLNVFRLWDKAAHFSAFAAGAAILAVALHLTTRWNWMKVVLVSILLISLFGITDEWHQLYTPHRSGGDLYDWLADTLGAILGAMAAGLFYVRIQRKNCPAPSAD